MDPGKVGRFRQRWRFVHPEHGDEDEPIVAIPGMMSAIHMPAVLAIDQTPRFALGIGHPQLCPPVPLIGLLPRRPPGKNNLPVIGILSRRTRVLRLCRITTRCKADNDRQNL